MIRQIRLSGRRPGDQPRGDRRRGERRRRATAARLALRAAALAGALGLGAGPAAALDLSIISAGPDRPVLMMQGPIGAGDAHAARSWLANGGFREVWLHSPGGSTAEAYKIGREIRSRRLATRVPEKAKCMSACVDILIGGVVRFVDPGAVVMIHPGSVTGGENFEQMMEGAVRKGQTRESVQMFEQLATAETATWIRYLTEMGVSLDLAGYAANVPHKCGIALKPTELVFFNITNTRGAPPAGYAPSDPEIWCPES